MITIKYVILAILCIGGENHMYQRFLIHMINMYVLQFFSLQCANFHINHSWSNYVFHRLFYWNTKLLDGWDLELQHKRMISKGRQHSISVFSQLSQGEFTVYLGYSEQEEQIVVWILPASELWGSTHIKPQYTLRIQQNHSAILEIDHIIILCPL